MQKQPSYAHFSELPATLLPQMEEDDHTLQSILHQTGTNTNTAKQAGRWLLEKFSRLKLGHTGILIFSMFQSIEVLSLGILGKMALWKAFDAATPSEPFWRMGFPHSQQPGTATEIGVHGAVI